MELFSLLESYIAFLFLHPLPYYIRTCFIHQAETGSYNYIIMVLYRPNFSLMFLIHLFLYAGIYGIPEMVQTLYVPRTLTWTSRTVTQKDFIPLSTFS